MKKFKKIILSILIAIALISAASPALTANAAAKNTVKTSVSKVVSTAKGFKVSWKKKSGIKGYQIQYSTSKKFTKSTTKTKTVSGAKNVSATISKLKGCNATYYVRIRTYKTVNGKNVYSSWSAVKKVTTLNHKYIAATCTKAKTCKYCGKTSGKALGHKYAAATCTKAKTCTRCKKNTGKALGHNFKNGKCIVCKVKNSSTGKITYVLNTKSFKFHRTSCGRLPTENRQDTDLSRSKIISQGYEPCGICHP